MQIYLIGTSFETAKSLSQKDLEDQIKVCKKVLKIINDKKEITKNDLPIVQQFKYDYGWLRKHYIILRMWKEQRLPFIKYVSRASICQMFPFYDEDVEDQMKRRLYTMDNEYYKDWSYLGESEEEWYWSWDEDKYVKYVNNERIN